MTFIGRFLTGVVLLLLVVAPTPAPAQEDGPPEAELREAMRSYFKNQLRMELALSDEQMEQIVPRIEQIEVLRTEARRRRMETMRELRRGLRQGAEDAELQARLEALDRIEVDERAKERELVAQVDETLTVRQRVQFRFFTQRFRQELQRRIQQLRRERMGEPGGFGGRPFADDGR